jgi:hypothetical protein
MKRTFLIFFSIFLFFSAKAKKNGLLSAYRSAATTSGGKNEQKMKCQNSLFPEMQEACF